MGMVHLVKVMPLRLLEVLDLYKPFVWEYGRLNVTHNVMSKRKLNKLVRARPPCAVQS